jgi:serine/threonine protein kinase/tetratricopeptide (TPR) repeat protein
VKPESHREENLFQTAAQLTGAERAALLDDACRGDPALRQRLEALLAAFDTKDSFVAPESPPPENKPVQTLKLDVADNRADDVVGMKVGRYKLLQEIGVGGFGVVYMAEQQEPVRRRVALKIIKLGMDTREVIARFEAERQALALMDHPNIAKVLDAGATAGGRPYFVMELVKGVRITEYWDKHNLTTRQRLDLFIQVCHAIQHAHLKGIIHRDIKPSNILIALQDGLPIPKVIDFGIAKATQQRLTEKTFFTARGDFVGTPIYMSPEQAEMTGMDIDTRSDIYSLGVVLYELLTGKTPFDPEELMAKGIEAMRRSIREEEPRRPSTRLTTMDKEELTTAAQRRQTDAPKLLHLVRGDLDWIVMKCLEKDRTRRYQTANELAFDLQRHVHNEPVLARPPSTAYRFQKMVRRNKMACAAVAAVALALLLGVVVSAWQAERAIQAEREQSRLRKEAEAESQKAKNEAERAQTAEVLARQRLAESEAISKFLTDVFRSPDPARDGRTITVAETLGVAARKLDTELADQLPRRARLQATLGMTYRALGLSREAIPLQEKVRDYYLTSFGPEHPDTLQAMNNLGNSYFAAGRRDEALKLREEVLALRRKVSGPEHIETLKAMNNLAVSYSEADRIDEALKLREEVVALRRKVLGPEHSDTLSAMQNLANSYAAAGRREQALKLREEVLTIRRKVSGPEHLYTLMAMGNLAISYDDTGRRDDALKLREEALAIFRKVSSPEHPDTLTAMGNLAISYDETGRRDEALKLREQVLALYRQVSGPEHPDTLDAMENLAISFEEAGRSTEAIALLAKVCEVNSKNTEAPLALATSQTWFGQDSDYEATRRRLLLQVDGMDQAATADRAARVFCLRPCTDATLLAKALDLAQQTVELGKSSSSLPSYQLSLGLVEYRNGQYAAAERNILVAEQTLGDQDKMQGIAHFFQAMTLFRQARAEKAQRIFSEAAAQMPPLPKDESKPIVDGRPFSHDLLIWWLAYKEAKGLIQAKQL